MHDQNKHSDLLCLCICWWGWPSGDNEIEVRVSDTQNSDWWTTESDQYLPRDRNQSTHDQSHLSDLSSLFFCWVLLPSGDNEIEVTLSDTQKHSQANGNIHIGTDHNLDEWPKQIDTQSNTPLRSFIFVYLLMRLYGRDNQTNMGVSDTPNSLLGGPQNCHWC